MPSCTFVAPSRRRRSTSGRVTQSGRVSTPRPTQRRPPPRCALRRLELGPARALRGVQPAPSPCCSARRSLHDPVVATPAPSSPSAPSTSRARQLAEARRRLRPPAARASTPRAEVVERVEAALHEPALVGLRVGRTRCRPARSAPPCRPGARCCGRPPSRFQVCRYGIEAVVLGALRAGLVGQVALRHAHVARAEDAPARARIGLRQHRHRRDTGERPHRAQPQPLHESGLRQPARLAPERRGSP